MRPLVFPKIAAIIDLILKVVSIAAIVIGGVWTYWNFGLVRTDIPNPALTVSTETAPYDSNLRLLIIHVKPKNIGKVLFQPGKKGFHLVVRKLPKNIQYGQLLELPSGQLFKRIDLLRHDEGYELEPGVEYDETETLVVSKGDIFYIEAELWFEDDEYSAVSKAVVRVQ
jgi:hypothetical protein